MKSESEVTGRLASPSGIIRSHIVGIVAGNVVGLITQALIRKYVLPLLKLDDKPPSIEESLGNLIKNLPDPGAAPHPASL